MKNSKDLKINSNSNKEKIQENLDTTKAVQSLREAEEIASENTGIIVDENVKQELIKSHSRDFYIVALGGSAGSYEAIDTFLRQIPPDSGLSFVVIQHLDPEHKSILHELLKRATSMEVIKVEDGIKVQPNKVYVIPENREMAILQGTLLLFQTSKPRGRQMPIDTFFESLALDWGDKAICIIFSGMGSDGELGARFIKEAIGMVMVQDPDNAKFDSMPRSTLKAGIADFVDVPEKLAKNLLSYTKYPVSNLKTKDLLSEKNTSNAMQKVFHLLRAKTGHDFSLYKTTVLYRRFERKMQTLHVKNMEEFVEFLQDNPSQVEHLFKELLIGVTKFFRDYEAFIMLKEKILPEILKNKKKDEPLRIWVAGCSSGEEAYSIAIVLKEILDSVKHNMFIKPLIYATDLDLKAIERARAGIFLGNIDGDVSQERLQKFFDKISETQYQIKKEIREMIVFAEHNLIGDPSFINIDLLTCRNLLIYFSSQLQKKLLPVLHYSLRPGGYLFLGSSESIGGFDDLFSVISAKWKFYQKRDTSASLLKAIDFPSKPSFQARYKSPAPKENEEKAYGIPDLIKKIILDRHVPPTIVINIKGDMVYIIGRTGKYLEPAPGPGRMNIFEMAREGLDYDLRAALFKASAEKKMVVHNSLKIKTNGDYEDVKLTVDPLFEPDELNGLFLVLFEPAPKENKVKISKKKYPLNEKDQIIDELERELKSSKENLQQTLEEMETSLEELKSSNEELQSTNEELQSTNEESTTAKEEMHALNEELMTVNIEVKAKTDELTRINNDMINLFNSSEIATIFLDNHLNIKRYTPKVVKNIIDLSPSDIGRSIETFQIKLKYETLPKDAKEVINYLIPKFLQVESREGKWYMVRILPYRTVDNFIDGAVITFNEIDELKKLEFSLKKALQFAENIINSVKDPLIVLDQNLKIISFNKNFEEIFKVPIEKVKDTYFYNLCEKKWDIPELKQLLMNTLQKENEFNGFEVEQEFPVIGKKKLIVNARKLIDPKDESNLILMAIEDVKN